jgi:hypothetical protein
MSTNNTSDHAILMRIEPWIFRLEGLSLLEKLCFSYIWGWSISNRCCESDTEWLGYKLGFTPNDIRTTLTLLEFENWIQIQFLGDTKFRAWANIEGVDNPCETCD